VGFKLKYAPAPTKRFGRSTTRGSDTLRSERSPTKFSSPALSAPEVDPKLRAAQMRAIKQMLSHGAVGILVEPGLGKTFMALKTAQILKAKRFIKRVLVISPIKPMYLTWEAENEKWQTGLTFAIAHGHDKLAALHRKVDVTLINPEGLAWLWNQKKRPKFDMLVVDESSKFKRSSTKRFKLLKRMLNDFDRRYILTGSPAPNGLMDLFGQVYILDGGDALGQYTSHYRLAYFSPAGYGGHAWRIQPGAAKRIMARIKPITFSMTNKEYGNLPKLVVQDVPVTLDKRAKEVYDTLENEMMIELKKGRVTAVNAAVVTMKLRQVANGCVYADAETKDPNAAQRQLMHGKQRKVLEVHREKVERLEELVDELEGWPLLVGYEFHHDRDAILKVFPKAAVFDADTKPRELISINTAWRKGEIDLLIAQTAAAAHGLNLQEGPGHAVCNFALTWNFEHYDQFMRRVWRTGQKRTTFLYRLYAVGTVDQDMIKALWLKKMTQNGVFEALKLRLTGRAR
jgi:SNF2 family DNA or RNA helicase